MTIGCISGRTQNIFLNMQWKWNCSSIGATSLSSGAQWWMIDMHTPGFTVVSQQLLDPNWMQEQQVKAGTQPIKIYQHYVTVSSL